MAADRESTREDGALNTACDGQMQHDRNMQHSGIFYISTSCYGKWSVGGSKSMYECRELYVACLGILEHWVSWGIMIYRYF